MKNPWMSLWLSAANTAANTWTGAARGRMAAEARRSQNAMVEEMTRQTMAFWTAGAAAPTKPAARRRRRTKV